MGILQKIYYAFAPYTDSHERAVGKFFAGLSEHSPLPSTRARVLELLQQNIAVINLWTEYRYKGYVYLSKSSRRQLYKNLVLIAADFDQFFQAQTPNAKALAEQLHAINPSAGPQPDRAVLLQALTHYFAPQRGIYEYRESSSFGRLLRDPNVEKLIGDCNQIVTLYIYLYSRYFSVQDLKIRLLPGHVALHSGGVDIETTNGTFTNYEATKNATLMPIEEIVCVNLLDTTDVHFAKHEVSPEDFLQSARFAVMLSHDRGIVTRNLEAAYGKLINNLMHRNNFTQALKFAKQSKDVELLSVVGNNGALFHLRKNDFAAARRFAAHAVKRDELVKSSYHAEGLYHYNAGRYHEAIRAFERYGDQSLVRSSYEALFAAEQQKLGQNLTTETIKNYAAIVKKMHHYAKKSGNKKMLDSANELRKHI